MEEIFSPVEIRVIGALIEKEITTPEYYPLTLNSLTNACNQKSNRDPVMSLDEKIVARALDAMRFRKIVWQVTTSGGRVAKYKHNISSVFDFSLAQKGILCELFLRGPQTLGELRTHASRFCEYKDLEEVESILQSLIAIDPGPMVVKLPREFGRKECRYAHLFCGEVKIDESKLNAPPEPVVYEIQAENKRIESLENDVILLKNELDDLRKQFDLFKKQFE